MIDIEKVLEELGFAIRKYNITDFPNTYLTLLPPEIYQIVVSYIKYENPDKLIEGQYYMFKCKSRRISFKTNETYYQCVIIQFNRNKYNIDNTCGEIMTINYADDSIDSITKRIDDIYYDNKYTTTFIDEYYIDEPIELIKILTKSYIGNYLKND